MSVQQTINDCFMLAWDEFGDDKSTEFLVQITADRLGIEPEEVYDAIAACDDEAALKTAHGTQQDEPSEVAIRHDRSDWRD